MITMTMTTSEQRDHVDVCPVRRARVDVVSGPNAWRVAGLATGSVLMDPSKRIFDKYTGVIVPERRGVT